MIFYIFKFIEKIITYIEIKLKTFYWKTKYGKRIKIGKNLKFRKGFSINITKDGYLEIGNDCFFNNYCSINCHQKIIIGDNNLFGENVKIYDHNHVFNNKNINMKTSFNCHDIIIGNNNWFGSNCVILSKTYIEDRNVFSANIIINSKYKSERIVSNKNCFNEEKILFKY